MYVIYIRRLIMKLFVILSLLSFNIYARLGETKEMRMKSIESRINALKFREPVKEIPVIKKTKINLSEQGFSISKLVFEKGIMICYLTKEIYGLQKTSTSKMGIHCNIFDYMKNNLVKESNPVLEAQTKRIEGLINTNKLSEKEKQKFRNKLKEKLKNLK